jgi:hypothetical protein
MVICRHFSIVGANLRLSKRRVGEECLKVQWSNSEADGKEKSVHTLHCNENPIYVFLFWELHGLSPNFYTRAIYTFAGSVHIFPAAE